MSVELLSSPGGINKRRSSLSMEQVGSGNAASNDSVNKVAAGSGLGWFKPPREASSQLEVISVR